MRLIGCLGLAMWICAGCGTGNREQTAGVSDTRPAPINSTSVANSPSHEQNSTSDNLAALMQEADRAEASMDFETAVDRWQCIRRQLESIHGSEHWQLVNCDRAIEMDSRLAKMTSQDQELYEQLRELDQQAQQQLKIGAMRNAMLLVQSAQPLAVSLFGNRGFLTLNLKMKEAQLQMQLGELDRAFASFQDYVNNFRQIVCVPHPELESAIFHLGLIERQRGHYERAIIFLGDAKKLAAQLNGQNDFTYARRCYDLGVTHFNARQFNEALFELAEAKEVRINLTSERHPLVAECMLNESAAHMELKQYAQASLLLNKIVEFADGSPAYDSLQLEALSYLATIDTLNKEFAHAESRLRAALDIEKRHGGDHCPKYAELSYRLAMNIGFQGRLADAEPVMQHALAVQRGLMGVHDPQARRTAAALVQLLDRIGMSSEAQRLCDEFSISRENSVTADR